MNLKLFALLHVITAFKKFRKFTEWGIFLLLMGLIVVVLSPILPTNSILSFFAVTTGSMEPALPTGSLVVVKPQNQYKVDDILVFPSPTEDGQVIIHRLHTIRASGESELFITKGDNNNSTDSWELFPDTVIGSVRNSFPVLGGLIMKLQTPTGFAMIFGILGIIFLIFQLFRIRDGIEEVIMKRVEREIEKRKREDFLLIAGAQIRQSIEKDGGNKNYGNLLRVIITLFLTIFYMVPATAYALFSSTVELNGLKVSTATEFPEPEPEPEPQPEWGMLNVYNKTTGELISDGDFTASTPIDQNIVFVPKIMTPESHHFTIIVKRMADDSMIHYRTMLSRWTMENYRKDGHLGYTFWQSGDFWLQVNAYASDGTPLGMYYSILSVQEPIVVSVTEPLEEILEGIE